MESKGTPFFFRGSVIDGLTMFDLDVHGSYIGLKTIDPNFQWDIQV